MTITKVYVASNGDIFAEYDQESEYVKQAPEVVAHAYAMAIKLLEEGKATPCEARPHKKSLQGISYYADGELLGTAGVQISDHYTTLSRYFYIARLSGRTDVEKLGDQVYLSTGTAVPLKEWAKAHGLSLVTARQRAARGAFNTARKVGRDWIIDFDEELIDHRFKGSS